MRQLRFFFLPIMASFLTVLALTGCRKELPEGYDDLYTGGGKTDVALALSLPKDVAFVNLGTRLSEEDEQALRNLCLMVYDTKTGQRELKKEYTQNELKMAPNDYQAAHLPGGESDTESTKTRGLLYLRGDDALKSGEKTFVIVCNYNMMADPSYYEFVGKDLEGLKTLSDVDKAIAKASRETSVLREKGLLITGRVNAEVKPNNNGIATVHVPLKRVDAKVTFNIRTADPLKINFTPGRIRVFNVPKSTFITEHDWKKNEGTNTWDASYSGTASGQDVNRRDPRDAFGQEIDGEAFEEAVDEEGNDWQTTTFYLPENRSNPVRVIDEEGMKGFAERQKQRKTTPGEDGAKVRNGDFENAPKYATYVEIEGGYTQQLSGGKVRNGNVTYRILLGYTDKDDPVNDYKVERNVHYTYNVIIKDVYDLIVEAMADDKSVEPSPFLEGELYDAGGVGLLDCHYEQRFLKISREAIRAAQNAGSISFRVSTPFDNRIITYTRAELDKLQDAHFDFDKVTDPKLKQKRADTDWLQFYFGEPNSGYDANGSPYPAKAAYYTKTTDGPLGKPKKIEEFLWHLLNPGRLIYDNENKCNVTVFVDEYFYKRTPEVGNIGEGKDDKDLWKRFCNRPNRSFTLFTAGDDSDVGSGSNSNRHVSPDGKSIYTEPGNGEGAIQTGDGMIAGLSQISIRTIFTDAPEGVRIWGMESIDETEDKIYYQTIPLAANKKSKMTADYKNNLVTNGWSNSWRSFGDNKEGAGIEASHQIVTVNGAHADNMWTKTTAILPNGQVVVAKEGRGDFIYRKYSINSRNRDLNKDDRMEANEIKWYIPSSAVLSSIVYAQGNRFPEFPLYSKGEDTKNLGIFSSRNYASNTNDMTVNVNNYIFYIPSREGGLNTSLAYNFLKDIDNIFNPGSTTILIQNQKSATRMIRDLGVIEDKDPKSDGERVSSYHMNSSEFYNEIKGKTWSATANKSERLIFRARHLLPQITRSNKIVNRELPSHSVNTSDNRIYRGGFEVAKYMAYKPGNSGTAGVDFDLYYRGTWKKLEQDLKSRDTDPCANYTQEPGRKDKGTWRVPNQAELQVMSEYLYDWYPEEAQSIYGSSLIDFGLDREIVPISTDPNKINVGKNNYPNYDFKRKLKPGEQNDVVHIKDDLKTYKLTRSKVWIHSRTTDSEGGNYGMYYNRYIRLVGTRLLEREVLSKNKNTLKFGAKGSDQEGFVRCVRDID